MVPSVKTKGSSRSDARIVQWSLKLDFLENESTNKKFSFRTFDLFLIDFISSRAITFLSALFFLVSKTDLLTRNKLYAEVHRSLIYLIHDYFYSRRFKRF